MSLFKSSMSIFAILKVFSQGHIRVPGKHRNELLASIILEPLHGFKLKKIVETYFHPQNKIDKGIS